MMDISLGTTVRAQSLLLRYCREHGYSDYKFMSVETISTVDKNGVRHDLALNLYGDILDLESREVVAVADTSHDIRNTTELPKRWKPAGKEER